MNLEKVEQLYTDSLRQYGAAPQAVGWRDPASHNLRFDKLSEILPDPANEIAFSVNDLGCGYGAYFEYLRHRGYRLSAFYGYDISQEMLVEATKRVTEPQASFFRASSLDRVADYSFASGIFNVRMDTAEVDWRRGILATLDNLQSSSRRGFAFNLLTSYVDWKEEHLYYGDPLFFFDYCKKTFSPRVALLHDYPLWEWTILVRMQS